MTGLLVSGCSLEHQLAVHVAKLLLEERAHGRYEYSGMLASRDAADSLVALLGSGGGWISVEVGVPRDDAVEIAGEVEAAWGALWLLRHRAPCDPTLVTLGFEVVGNDWGHLHSWLCNGLERDALERLSVRTGRFGLIPTLDEARAVAELVNKEELGEPVNWLICRLSVDAETALMIAVDEQP